MRSFKTIPMVVAALMLSSVAGNAADIIPPIETYPPEVVPVSTSGWYIRGDIGYANLKSEGVRYFQGASQTGRFEQHELGSTWMLQGGIGYQMTDYMRADLTLGFYDGADFTGSSALAVNGGRCNNNNAILCDFQDNAELESMTVLMANAYWDLGTYQGFTPYVGAGVGGAHVSWGNLFNDETCVDTPANCAGLVNGDANHPGEDQWRFAWALHAGASYDVRCDLKIDAGYTYTSIEGGKMFAFGTGSGLQGTQGYDDHLHVHTAKAGLRYMIGGCAEPVVPIESGIVYK